MIADLIQKLKTHALWDDWKWWRWWLGCCEQWRWSVEIWCPLSDPKTSESVCTNDQIRTNLAKTQSHQKRPESDHLFRTLFSDFAIKFLLFSYNKITFRFFLPFQNKFPKIYAVLNIELIDCCVTYFYDWQ